MGDGWLDRTGWYPFRLIWLLEHLWTQKRFLAMATPVRWPDQINDYIFLCRTLRTLGTMILMTSTRLMGKSKWWLWWSSARQISSRWINRCLLSMAKMNSWFLAAMNYPLSRRYSLRDFILCFCCALISSSLYTQFQSQLTPMQWSKCK